MAIQSLFYSIRYFLLFLWRLQHPTESTLFRNGIELLFALSFAQNEVIINGFCAQMRCASATMARWINKQIEKNTAHSNLWFAALHRHAVRWHDLNGCVYDVCVLNGTHTQWNTLTIYILNEKMEMEMEIEKQHSWHMQIAVRRRLNQPSYQHQSVLLFVGASAWLGLVWFSLARSVAAHNIHTT